MKKIYPDYLLLFKTNKNKIGYRSFGIDNILFLFIRDYSTQINVVEDKLIKMHINYLLIDNLQILKVKKFKNNMYNYYMYKFVSLDILDRIRVCVFR